MGALRIFLGYVPTPHAGYEKLLQELDGTVNAIYVMGSTLLERYPHLKKDLRRLSPESARKSLRGMGFRVEVLEEEALREHFVNQKCTFVLPNEDIMRDLADWLGITDRVEWVSTFLRHTSENSTTPKEIEFDCEVSTEELQQQLMGKAFQVSEQSSDWWRQVGAVAVRDGEILITAYNHHLPTEYTPYIDGDPRSDFKKGLHIECSTANHAEATLISRAARNGIALEGATLYSSTFPCPPCAKLVAEAGFATCYFGEGYGTLDGATVLRDAGTKLVRVHIKSPSP
ncbi:MAG TPA: deaminase [Verrucomicrobiae bacterium]|nr:deaminase [Verrucomicrobiae bacterium]